MSQTNATDKITSLGADMSGAARTASDSLTAEPVVPPISAEEPTALVDQKFSTELLVPQPPSEDGAPGTPEAPRQEPVAPLKTYAQIPTEMMQEISRLREEAAEANAQGVPGRNDPTPMPAAPAAIGTGSIPYDAA
ncbi:MAG: hypothetical protein AAGG09_20140 [Pseudomonadota bacterium]